MLYPTIPSDFFKFSIFTKSPSLVNTLFPAVRHPTKRGTALQPFLPLNAGSAALNADEKEYLPTSSIINDFAVVPAATSVLCPSLALRIII